MSELPQRAVFLPSATVKEGYLHKFKSEGPQLLSRFAFKKRYFWLTSETLTYAKSPDWQVGINLMVPPVTAQVQFFIKIEFVSKSLIHVSG